MVFAHVLRRDRNGREILWRCSECGKAFDLGWGSRCNVCIREERLQREIVEALKSQPKLEAQP